jgi:hypothetical protein
MAKDVCKHGHVRTPENLYSDGSCRECKRLQSKKWWVSHKEQHNEYMRKHRADNPAVYQLRNKTSQRRFSILKYAAKSRQFDVLITLQEWAEITSKPCFYCGGKLPDTGSGVDRIDSGIGYTKENCRPCCTDCNIAKSNMTEEEFKAWIIRIYGNWAAKAA